MSAGVSGSRSGSGHGTRARRRAARMGACAAIVAAGLVAAGAPAARADSGAPEPDHIIHYTTDQMGTVINLTIWGDNQAKAARAAHAVFKEFSRVDRVMSSWLPDSAVSRINDAAGRRWVPVSAEVFKVIERAEKVSRRSGGAFDITVGAFRGVWKFDQDMDGSIPTAAQVAAREKLVNYRDVLLDHHRRRVKLRHHGMRITLGGIAKGYAVDRGVAILRRRGFVNFILQAGGDMYVSGTRGDRKWRVGIRDPRGPRGSTFCVAAIENHTFSTSGDYERGFVKNGIRYSHIINPKTGQPARLSRSVTVMAKDAITADAWSTTLFVLGPKKGMAIVEKTPDLDAVFVDSHNHVSVSSGLKGKILMMRKPTPGI